MTNDPVIRTRGPYLRVVLPDVAYDWVGIWQAVEPELVDGIERAEIVAPCYVDEGSLAGVRGLVTRLEHRGVEAIVTWRGLRERDLVPVGRSSFWL